MKRKIITLVPLISLLLTGCFALDNSTTSSGSNGSHTSSHGGSSSGGSSSGSSTGTTTIDIYATNDIHGRVYSEDNQVGIGKMMTFLKEKGDHENTLLLDQGDTWQGSIYSNYNRGALITDIMNYVRYDARTVGNHDFDWGTTYLAQNSSRTYEGYSTPVLAGNVYDYNMSTHQFGTTQQSQLGSKSVTYTLENGLKVGILGCIGKDQITSICTEYTRDIGFTNHVQFIKEEATHLRNDEHCDVVICSIHAPMSQVSGNGLANYIDLCLCGHSHDEESGHEGNLYYSQNLAYTKSCGHIQLTYDSQAGKVVSTSIECIDSSTISSAVDTVNPSIQALIDTYADQCNTAANQVVAANVNGGFYSTGTLPNLMCRAIYDECISEGYSDIAVSYVNQARVSLSKTAWTYADLYDAFPFDNVVYIAEITGTEFLNQIKNNYYIYRSPSFTNDAINPSGTYKIAVLDYLYLHTNSNRYYNYFPTTGGTSSTTLTKNYREILRNWLISNDYNTSQTLNYSTYLNTQWSHDRTNFYSA